MSREEDTNLAAALALGNDRVRLRQRLLEATELLRDDLRRLFFWNRFDFEGRRLLSDDGRYALEWLVRLFPGQPAGLCNQQTNCGVVVCVRRAPKEVEDKP